MRGVSSVTVVFLCGCHEILYMSVYAQVEESCLLPEPSGLHLGHLLTPCGILQLEYLPIAGLQYAELTL